MTDCSHCQQPIERVGYRLNYDTGHVDRRPDERHLTTWFHTAGPHRSDDGHTAEPAPQCPACGSANYRLDQTDPWADHTHCGDCGHTHRRPLGD